MRERISRGKRIDNNEWIYWNRYGRLTDINGEPTNIEINTSALRPYAFYINELPVIREDAVGDYTGLTDKNGKPIFEGDILKVYETQEHAQNVSVSYENGQFIVSHYALKLLSDRALQSEVIGNIHDNPELLRTSNESAQKGF